MNWLKRIFQFIIIVLLQVLVLNQIQFSEFITPYIYVLFILILPFDINKILFLILAFFTGITIDIFTNTPGLHTSAIVLMAFCRPYVLKSIAPRDGYESGAEPLARDMGLKWFAMYSGILIFIHHLFFFYVQVFSFTQFFITLERCVASFVFSLILVLISQLFFSKRSTSI